MSSGGGSSAPDVPEEQRQLFAEQAELLSTMRELAMADIDEQTELQRLFLEDVGIRPVVEEGLPRRQRERLQSELQQVRQQLQDTPRTFERRQFTGAGFGPQFMETVREPNPEFEQLREQERQLLQQLEAPEEQVVGFERDPAERQRIEDIRRLQQDVQVGALERQEAALAGEVPLDPALQRRLEEEEQQVRETLRQQLGPGFEQTTPGQEALGRLARRREEAIAQQRVRDIQLGGIVQPGGAAMPGQQAQVAAGVAPGMGAQAQTLGQVVAGQGRIGQQFAQQQQLSQQQQQFQAGQRAQALGGIGQLAGMGIGATIGGPQGALVGGSLMGGGGVPILGDVFG